MRQGILWSSVYTAW